MEHDENDNKSAGAPSALNVWLGSPDLYWPQDADHGYECPDDAAIVGNMPLGTEFELTAAWYQTKKFKVVKVADDVSDDIEVIEVPNRY
jgi:hypothetical protein